MPHILFSTLILALTMVVSGLQAADPVTIRVITDRTESHLKPLFAKFQEASGIAVEAIYVEKGLLTRLQANPSEADVVITSAAENLERARVGKLLRAFESPVLAALPAEYLDADRMYAVLSYRARGLFVSKHRVAAGAVTTYADLIKPEMKGKVLIRSGSSGYNIAMFCQMVETRGLEWTKAFLAGLKANRARVPKGNDRGQVQAVRDGVGDVSVGNSYYMPLMLANAEQKPWAEAVSFIFPDQQGTGAYVLQSGVALTVSNRAVPAATKLLEYLVGEEAQTYMANTIYEYAINPKVAISEVNKKTLGIGQAGVVDGRFKVHKVSLRASDQHRDAVVKLLNDLNFDQ